MASAPIAAPRKRLDLAHGAEDGQTMAEYAVVLAVITPLVVAIFSLLGASVSNEISKVAGYINF